MQAAGQGQTLHDANVFCAHLGPIERPVFPAHRDGAQRALEMNNINQDIRTSAGVRSLRNAHAGTRANRQRD
jgi:hypothetical protein